MHRSMSPVSVLPPTFEQHHSGFGIQCARPRLSWRFSCSNEEIYDWTQTAYDVEVSTDDMQTSEVFNIKSTDSVLVPWPCPNVLNSRARRLVRVRCYGKYSLSHQTVENATTEWSEQSLLEIALLHQNDWVGRMITVSQPWPINPDGSVRPLCFHKSFDISHQGIINKARLFITSHGVYNAVINGSQVGDHCMAPGYQSYHKRLHYQVYDVRDLLTKSGSNKIEVEVAAGWFASAWTWTGKRYLYGQELGVLAQLEIWFESSSTPLTVCTD